MQDFLPAEYGTAASALQAAFTVAEVTSAAEEHLEDGKGVGVGRMFFFITKPISLRLAVLLCKTALNPF